MLEFGPIDDSYGLYSHWMRRQGDAICELLTKRLIRKCQSEVIGLKSDTVLKNLWEEICVSLREDSVYSPLYEEHLENRMTTLVDALPPIERQILWLMSYDGVGYATTPDPTYTKMLLENNLPFDTFSDKPKPSTNPQNWPIDSSRLAREIIQDYVKYECGNYQNARIRACTGE